MAAILPLLFLTFALSAVHGTPSQSYYSHSRFPIDQGIIGYPKVTPPPHPANERISELIGSCSCPAMKTSCDPIVIYRENPKVVQVPGERRTVYLNKERLQELPIREPVTLDKDYADVQRLPAQVISQPVELIREVLREEVEYYDVVVERIEIQYNDVIERVILEEEEPQLVEETIDEPVRVQLKEETLNVVNQPETIYLSEEIANQVNETMTVRQTFYDIRAVPDERSEVIQCENYKIVKIPRDDCAEPKHINGYLPPP